MGINFSRVLTLKYGNNMTAFLGGKWTVVSVGRVMTCVLGMVVKREREIRNFVKKPFYRVIGVFGGIEAEWRAVPGSEYCLGVIGKAPSGEASVSANAQGGGSAGGASASANAQGIVSAGRASALANVQGAASASGASALPNAQGAASTGGASALAIVQGTASSDVTSGVSGTAVTSRQGTASSNAASASGKPGEAGESNLILSPLLYKENGFHRREDAEELIRKLREVRPQEGIVTAVSRKKEKKNPPLLYNLAELQNDCSKMFKISPDQTLSIAQELYEKKMTTYPRTDARVLSSAVAKVIDRNLKGLQNFTPVRAFAGEILEGSAWKNIGKSRYTNDKAITDHYAIIPTGAGLSAYNSLSPTACTRPFVGDSLRFSILRQSTIKQP